MLRNPLNENDVNGNTMAWMSDESYYIRKAHICPDRKEEISEDEWNDKRGKCYDCFWGLK